MLNNFRGASPSARAEAFNAGSATTVEDPTEKFNLSALCERLMDLLDPTSNHIISVHGSWINGDLLTTEQALRCLLKRTLARNRDESLSITIEAVDLSANSYRIMVADNGRCLPEGQDRFSSTREEMDKVKQAVTARGGEFTEKNDAYGKGVCASFSLAGCVMGFPSQQY
ncbi:MAG: hypothetical protein AB8B96_09605 [Lysobacterales bacterium]